MIAEATTKAAKAAVVGKVLPSLTGPVMKATLVAKLAPSLLGHAPGPKKVAKAGAVAMVAKRAGSLERALAGASLAVGVGELVMPKLLDKMVGVRPTSQTVAFTRACGAREVAEGAAIIAAPRPAYGLWSRVAGDAMDLGVLGRSLADKENRRGRLAAATAVVAGMAALDVFAGLRANGTRRR